MSKDDAIRNFCDELMGTTSFTIFSKDAGAILAEAYPIIVELLRGGICSPDKYPPGMI